MPKKTVLVDFNKCRPMECSKDGVCKAAQVCKYKLLKQESPNEPPMPDPAICKGCGDCVLVCPLKALKIS